MKSLVHYVAYGWSGVRLAYLTVLVGMLVALRHEDAALSMWLRAPFSAVPMLLFCLVVLFVTGLMHFTAVEGSLIALILSGLIAAALGYVRGTALVLNAKAGPGHRRGAVVSLLRDMTRREQPAGVGPDRRVTLAGLRIAAVDETKHFKLIGTTGTGKSTAIREILRAALERGDRAVIADPDGGYLADFYDEARGDVILNPFEQRALKWSLMGEIQAPPDVDQLARSLIPDSADADRVWSGYARTFFTAVVQQGMTARLDDDAELYRLINRAPVAELKVLLEGTAAGPFLEEGNEKMFGSVRAVTNSALSALRYTTQQAGVPFSVRQWVRQGGAVKNGGRGGVLFLPYKAGEIAALRSVISAWMRMAIFEVMNGGEGDQRVWFVVDELDALGEIDGLKDALSRLRKFGGRCVLGFQSISQVSSTYGGGTADTIVENCGNTLILRCSASERGGTSSFASTLIGQREVVYEARSKTRQPEKWMAAETTSEQRVIEPAVMASEIERLEDLEGYLKFASGADWMRVSLRRVEGVSKH